MTSYVVTEGRSDVEVVTLVVRRFLADRSVVVTAGQGKSSAVSLARSLLAVRKEPVVLLLDADTVNADLVHEQRAGLETLLGLVAAPGSWKVALFEPTLERCLFRDARFAEQLFCGPLSERHGLLAEYDPKRALAELAHERWHVEPSPAEVGRRLARCDLQALMLEPAIRETVQFLEQVSERSAA